MAYVKCSGGGKLRETILWENPDPSVAFASHTNLTIAQDINNFNFIGVKYYPVKGNYTNMGYNISPVSYFKNYADTKFSCKLGMCSNVSNKSTYSRNIFYVSDTSVYIGTSYLLSSTTHSVSNNNCIPYQIIGLK